MTVWITSIGQCHSFEHVLGENICAWQCGVECFDLEFCFPHFQLGYQMGAVAEIIFPFNESRKLDIRDIIAVI